MSDADYMALALAEAEAAAARGEVPVGAVLVDAGGRVVARAGNAVEALADPTAHAEVQVIRAVGAARGRPRLPDLTLYVTLEPCTMCAAAIAFARISRVVFGAPDPKGGGIVHGARFYGQPTCHHRPEVLGGVMAEPSARLLRAFFRARRGARRELTRNQHNP